MKKIKIILLVLIGAVIGGIISIKASELISSSQVLYKDNNTVSQALDELFASVDINERLGATDISGIGDGTITDSISKLNSKYNTINNNLPLVYLQKKFTTDPNGVAYLGVNSPAYSVVSVVCETQKYYVDYVWVNIYNMWYVKIFNISNNSEITEKTDVTLNIILKKNI